MRLEALDYNRIGEFIDYCKKHRSEVDESFLYDSDLIKFKIDNENPTYIVIDENNKIKGAVSLIIDEYNKRGKRGRFRIFHCEVDDIRLYNMFMQAILKNTEGLDNIYIFIPMINTKLIEYIKKLNFEVERYSFVMVRDINEKVEFILPKGYEIRAFREGIDESAWCEVRNSAFAKLKGSETPITKEMVKKMLYEEDYIDGGLKIMYHENRAIGVVRGAKDEYEGLPIMNIGPLAIIPEYQGRGLGRILLRAALCFAKNNSYDRVILCVNGENERAKSLYVSEGFKQVEGAVCFRYNLN